MSRIHLLSKLPRPVVAGSCVAIAGVLLATGYTLGDVARAGGAAAAAPVRIDPKVRIGGEEPIPRKYLAAGSPVPMAGEDVAFAAADGSMRAGVWDTGPGTLELDMTFNEYVYVVSGKTILRSTDGRSWTFGPGDAFVLPKGFKGTARQVGHFRKIFVDVNPPAR